jgi:DNA repair protein RecO (recombination protein O)
MEEPFRLAGLSTFAGLAQILPEREPHKRIYEALLIILDAIDQDDIWPALLVRWEMGLLDELGFGLDLTKCAATGAKQELVYVSPKTGRAVSAAAGEPYRERLLALPPFLVSSASATPTDILDGFKLTGHFLARHIFEPRGITAPEQRQQIIRTLTERG